MGDSKAKIALGASAASAIGQTALQLSDYHNLPLAVGLVVLMVAPLGYVVWHTVNAWRGKRGRPTIMLEPWHIIVVGLLIAAGGVIWQQVRQPTAAAMPTSATPAATAPIRSTKFYSQRNKNDLADALTDLSVILNGPGEDIVKKHQAVVAKWNQEWAQLGQSKMPDAAGLVSALDALSNSTVVFSRALYDDNGFIKKYQPYSDELNPILQFTSASGANSPLAILQRSINQFRNGLSTVVAAEKYNDPRLASQMMQNLNESGMQIFLKGDDSFRAWLYQIRQRMSDFRKALQ